ncbi:MAG: tryptophan 2,3-dioxygenase [Kiloniellales bacterium]|nr:tryptophan 2,3-dioxygenase [Kiloniellales bacterium]
MSENSESLTYAKHLCLDTLLDCQRRQSALQGCPAHDEMLFITVHQAYELWFKQILFELDRVQTAFSGETVDERNIGQVVHGLIRIVEINKLLVQQLDVLETMTPLDFLDFRDLLFPASGFQSVQFRLLETRLGLARGERLSPDARPFDATLGADDRVRIGEAESRPSLADNLESWLERTPFVSTAGYRFQEAYRQAVAEIFAADSAMVRANPALGEAKKAAELESLASAQRHFDSLFDPEKFRALREQGLWRFSSRALQAALFINLYRDEPALQLPFRLLSLLMDMDETLTLWRYRHALMAQRMIGRKVGTGGSSGFDYLRQSAERHRVFADLFALSTFFIPRSKLPPLPDSLRREMDFRYAESQTEANPTDGPA